MFGKKSAIRKYLKVLPDELARRYGGSGPYTPAQVERTVLERNLSTRHIHYAWLLFCEREVLYREGIEDSTADKMLQFADNASSTGIKGLMLATLTDANIGDGGGTGLENNGGSGGTEQG